MKKITIVNGWSDLNTGDSSIIISMIGQIINKVDNVEINIISELNEKNEYFHNSINFIKESYKDLKINLIGSAFYKNYEPSINNKLKEILSLFFNFLLILLPKKIFKRITKNNIYYSSLLNSDIILSKGGHFIHDRGGIKGVIHLFKCLYPMLVCIKLNKRYSIISQSIGPFKKKGVFSKLAINMCKKIFENAFSISLRENVSYECLKELQLKNENIFLTSDYAFLLPKYNNVELPLELKNILNGGKFVVITIRQHDFKENDGEREYLSTINKIATYIKTIYGLNIVFFPHVQGPNSFENDKIIIEKFKLEYDKAGNYIYVNGFYSPHIIKEFYGNAELMIGTRFHSVIFALSRDVPSLAISYSGYKANIMNQVDMNEFMIEIEEVKIENYNELREKIDKLLNNKDNYCRIIKEKRITINNNINNDKAFIKSLGQEEKISEE